MNRLLAGTAVSLLLGLIPGVAAAQAPETIPPDEPAMQAPAAPSGPSGAAPSLQDPAQSPPSESQAPPEQSGPQAANPPEATPAPSRSAEFLNEQKPDDWLATNLIGRPVVNAKDETIGDINDIVTDRNGKVVAVLIGSGGFLGLGEKDVGVRFEDLRLARSEDNKPKIILDVDKEMLASAPDYKTLGEQQVVEGANKSDREDRTSTY
jgi:hypothetical protein